MEELTASVTARKYAIDNEPHAEAAQNLRSLAVNILQPIREAYGKPITINSAYRSAALNRRVKGSKTSQHLTGEAADISVKGSKAELFRLILKMVTEGKLQVGQLIWEYGSKEEPRWIHVSLPRSNGKPNNQVIYYYDT